MNTAQLLEEAISDRVLKKDSAQHNLRIILDMAKLAIPVVLRAGSAGNVQCRAVMPELLSLQAKLKTT